MALLQTFSYTGGQQTYVVPAGVSMLYVEAFGAQGGTGLDEGIGIVRQGGRGGRVRAALPVTPGETLYINIGGQPQALDQAGWNGGGAGRPSAAGGGGATDIRQGGTALSNRKIVAGGGGGGGSAYVRDGRGGGGLTGPASALFSDSISPSGGGNGTQSAGGGGGQDSGHYAYPSASGSLGQGAIASSIGAGGGGGYYGGGSGGSWYDGYGYGGGGGGGSSYFSGLTGATRGEINKGNGSVSIYSDSFPTYSVKNLGGTGQYANGNSGAVVSLNKPYFINEGELLVFCVTVKNISAMPSGLTAAANNPAANSEDAENRAFVYYKIATASEPATYSFTAGGGSDRMTVGLIVFENATSPSGAWAGPTQPGVNPLPVPSFNMAKSGSLVTLMTINMMSSNNGYGGNDHPVGFDEIWDWFGYGGNSGLSSCAVKDGFGPGATGAQGSWVSNHPNATSSAFISAFGVYGNSPPSNPGTPTVTPNPPDGSATISWAASSDVDSDPITYSVFLSTNGGSSYTHLGNTTNTSMVYDFTNQPEVTNARVRVQAYSGSPTQYSGFATSAAFTISHGSYTPAMIL